MIYSIFQITHFEHIEKDEYKKYFYEGATETGSKKGKSEKPILYLISMHDTCTNR